MLIQISDGCYVAADQIAEVKISGQGYGPHITVRTKDGVGHMHEPRHGQSVYEAMDQLVAKINAVTQLSEGAANA